MHKSQFITKLKHPACTAIACFSRRAHTFCPLLAPTGCGASSHLKTASSGRHVIVHKMEDAPLTHKEAIACKDRKPWKPAMNSELNSSLMQNNAWTLCESPEGGKMAGGEWMFERKMNAAWHCERHEARSQCRSSMGAIACVAVASRADASHAASKLAQCCNAPHQTHHDAASFEIFEWETAGIIPSTHRRSVKLKLKKNQNNWWFSQRPSFLSAA